MYKKITCLFLIVNFAAKSAENTMMLMVKTGLKRGAEMFLNKLPSAIITAIPLTVHSALTYKLNNHLKQDEAYKKINANKNEQVTELVRKRTIVANNYPISMNGLSEIIWYSSYVIDLPGRSKNCLVGEFLLLLEKPVSWTDEKYVKYIFNFPRTFIKAPRTLSNIFLEKITTENQIKNYPLLVGSYNLLFFTINLLWVNLLYDRPFSKIAKIYPISWCLNKLPWWMKFSIADHVGEKVVSYCKKQPHVS